VTVKKGIFKVQYREVESGREDTRQEGIGV
jgi:hypothetical protein